MCQLRLAGAMLGAIDTPCDKALWSESGAIIANGIPGGVHNLVVEGGVCVVWRKGFLIQLVLIAIKSTMNQRLGRCLTKKGAQEKVTIVKRFVNYGANWGSTCRGNSEDSRGEDGGSGQGERAAGHGQDHCCGRGLQGVMWSEGYGVFWTTENRSRERGCDGGLRKGNKLFAIYMGGSGLFLSWCCLWPTG